MSSTNRSDVRHPDDFYRTESWVSRAILPHIIRPDTVVCDPCAGDGAILHAVRDWRREHTPSSHAFGIELNPERAGIACSAGHLVQCADFFDVSKRSASPDTIVMNPPFSEAERFITEAIRWVRGRGWWTVAALLRLNWLASQERADFHRANPSDVGILPVRPSFAVSLKCKARKGPSRCPWATLLPLDADRPAACPTCGSGVDATTTDSADYGWFLWGEGRGGRWFILDVERPEAKRVRGQRRPAILEAAQ